MVPTIENGSSETCKPSEILFFLSSYKAYPVDNCKIINMVEVISGLPWDAEFGSERLDASRLRLRCHLIKKGYNDIVLVEQLIDIGKLEGNGWEKDIRWLVKRLDKKYPRISLPIYTIEPLLFETFKDISLAVSN